MEVEQRRPQVGPGRLGGTVAAYRQRYAAPAGDALLPVAIGTATTGVRTVPGFEEGITGMRVGGRRKLVIPPALAYGRQGELAGQVLVFDVELVEIR